MKVLKYEGITFKGQYGDALQMLLEGKVIDMDDFYNGSWEATKQLGNFISKLKQTNINYVVNSNSNNSLRSTKISLIGDNYDYN